MHVRKEEPRIYTKPYSEGTAVSNKFHQAHRRQRCVGNRGHPFAVGDSGREAEHSLGCNISTGQPWRGYVLNREREFGHSGASTTKNM